MVLKFVTLVLCITAAVSAREIPNVKPGYGEDPLVECWDALKELTACSNEIILFLISGEAKLGPPCCAAVKTITRECWPAMLTVAGISAEEGNILNRYCDQEAAAEAAGPATAPVQYSIYN